MNVIPLAIITYRMRARTHDQHGVEGAISTKQKFINKASVCDSRTTSAFVSEGSKRVKTVTLSFKLK
jgi:hypothetical protein